MSEEINNAIKFVIFFACLAIFIVLLRPDILASARANTTIQSATFKITQTSVEAQLLTSGNVYTYNLKPKATIILSESKQNTNIVPVVSFKGQDSVLESIEIKKGDDTGTLLSDLTIKSNIPPVYEIGLDGPLDNMIEGQESWYQTQSMGVFKVKLLKVSQPPFEDALPESIANCRATFAIECKDLEVKTTLTKCEDQEIADNSCKTNLKLCGSDVSITQWGDVVCDTKSVEGTEVLTNGEGVPWEDGKTETMIIGFFEQSECTINYDKLDQIENCAFAKHQTPTVVEVHFTIPGITK